MSCGNEGGDYEKNIKRVETLLKENRGAELNWKFEAFPEENHVSMVIKSAYNSLSFIYRHWGLEDAPKKTIAEIEEHYKKLTQRFGYKIEVPVRLISGKVYFAVNEKRYHDALKVNRFGIRLYPNLSRFYVGLAESYEHLKKYKEALDSFKEALKRETDHASPAATRIKENIKRLNSVGK